MAALLLLPDAALAEFERCGDVGRGGARRRSGEPRHLRRAAFVLFLRFMHPFRWVHPYGVFPPNTTPGAKITILLEGSWDKATWHELDLHFCPSNPRSPPRFIAPYHPRLDQAVIYDTFGLNPTSLLSSVLGGFDPYAFGSRLPAVGFCQAILRGSGLSLVGGGAIATHAGPPLLVRMTTVMLEPVSLEEHRKTGVWWKRSYVGPHVSPQELDPRFSEDAIAEPELWHFDAIFWRRRSRLRGLMDRALRGKEDPMQLATSDAGNLSAADVERFWNDFRAHDFRVSPRAIRDAARHRRRARATVG